MVEIIIPRPPSINRLWRIGRGRMFRSAEYVNWLNKCELLVKAMKVQPILGSYKLLIRAKRPDKRRRDIDNIGGKAINDMLQKTGIVEDDCLCEVIVCKWVKNGPDTSVIIVPMGEKHELRGRTKSPLQSGTSAAADKCHQGKESPAQAYARLVKTARGRVGFKKS